MKALAEAFEQFYSPTQARDDHGRWTSGGGGGGFGPPVTATTATAATVVRSGSADPYNRTAPIPTLRIRVNSLDDPHKDPQVQRVRSWYEGDLGNGYTSRAAVDPERGWDGVRTSRIGNNEGKSGDNTVTIDGLIEKGDQIVGTFKRTATYFPHNDQLFVTHDELMIQPEHQGYGLAAAMNARAFEGYRKAGVDHVKVNASDEVGGFAWARQGYRVEGGGRDHVIANLTTRTVDAVKTAHGSRHLSTEQAAEARRRLTVLDKASSAGQDVQPGDVARVGETDLAWTQQINGANVKMWPGKAGLLGSSWHGAYYFDAATAVTGSAFELETALRRHTERVPT